MKEYKLEFEIGTVYVQEIPPARLVQPLPYYKTNLSLGIISTSESGPKHAPLILKLKPKGYEVRRRLAHKRHGRGRLIKQYNRYCVEAFNANRWVPAYE